MTDAAQQQATFGTLVRRIGAAVMAHKALVSAAIGLGLLETFFTKGAVTLLGPLMRALSPSHAQESGKAAEFTNRFCDWFQHLAHDLTPWIGMTSDGPDATPMQVVVACAIAAAACGVIGALCVYGLQITSRYFAIKMVADLRCDVARHLLSLPLRYFGNRRMGELISNVTNDAQVLQRSFELASDNVILDPMMIVGNLVLLLLIMPQAVYVMVVMVPLMAWPMYRAGRKVRKRSTRTLEAMGEATESMNQILSGIRTVKAFRLEQRRLLEYEDNNRTFLSRTLRMLRAKAMSMAQTFIGYQLGTGVLILLLGYTVLVARDVEVNEVPMVIVALSTTYQHVKRLTRSYTTLMESVSALDRIEGILVERPDVADTGGEPLTTVRGHVELRDVWFAYGEEPVLRGISLVAEPGQTIAFVGPSGGGKSTTLDLLLRFHDPSRGAILIDGRDLRSLRMEDYRAHTAVVSQQPFLFNTSIGENIAYGRPGATPAEIEAAAKAANIHDFIAALPQGYATLAGERGCNLSGGQMQRITIARAIVRNPAILFLDEATSALDSENEKLVQKALDLLRQGRTSFVIAHRLSTISAADVIVVIEDGRIVEQGPHQELLARNGAYARMWEKQTVPE